ncbi:ash family protein [Escherichia coli]
MKSFVFPAFYHACFLLRYANHYSDCCVMRNGCLTKIGIRDYIHRTPAKSGVGIRNPGYSTATDTRRERVFYCRMHTHI